MRRWLLMAVLPAEAIHVSLKFCLSLDEKATSASLLEREFKRRIAGQPLHATVTRSGPAK